MIGKTLSRFSSFLLVFVMLICSTAFPIPVRAVGILYVSPTGIGDCSSWASTCTLQTALASAVNGNEIWAAAGIYKPDDSNREMSFALKNGVAIYGGFDGTETLLGQRNPLLNTTVLSGDIGVTGNSSDNSYHVITGSNTDLTARLDGFTINAGNGNGSTPNDAGGGVFNSSGSPTLTNLIINNNSAAYGGGMMNINSSNPIMTDVFFNSNSATNSGGGLNNSNSSNPTLTNVTFTLNSAPAGGGIFNQDSSPLLTSVVFENNTATDRGGGIFNLSSTPSLANVTFSTNTATSFGGGMFNLYSSPTLTNVTFTTNSSQIGGGMFSIDSTNPTLVNVTFISNSATNQGGGMLNYSSNPTLTNVAFTSNSAKVGGGMFNQVSNPALSGVTFNGNTANSPDNQSGGGGMYNVNSNPSLTNITFENNTSYLGGGMFSTQSNPTLTNITFHGNNAYVGSAMINDNGNPAIRNTIIWGNTSTIGTQVYNNNANPTITYSDIQGGCPAESTCSNIIDINPLLGALDIYGGTTQVFPLLPGSPAINAGDVTNCPATDQRGVSRPQNGVCDMGAFESRVFTLSIIGGNDQSTLINTVFSSPLSLSVAGINGDPVNGGMITFSPPSTGAGAVLSSTSVTITNQAVSVSATANNLAGSYNVVASASGASSPSTFHLINLINGQLPVVLYGAPQGLTSGGCDSWANACELQYALSIAPSGYEIWVKAGSYTPTNGIDRFATFQLKNGVSLYGGFAGTEGSREARDPAAHQSILSGDIGVFYNNSDNSYHVVTASGTNNTSVIDGFHIVDGNAENGCADQCQGGGMYNNGGNPTLNDVVFMDNNAKYGGGGMYNMGGSSPTLTNVTFDGNSASGQYSDSAGGGMYNTNSNPTLSDVTFVGNIARVGGGLANAGSNPTLVNVIFSYNTSTFGGGGMNNLTSNPTLTDVIFYGNNSSWGGGLSNEGLSNPSLTKVTFTNNSATNGGGMANDASNSTLMDVTFQGNSAFRGGGMYNFTSQYSVGISEPTLTNVTFSGNSASSGGGMYNESGSHPTLTNVTFNGNSAGAGGGMYNKNSSPTLTNVTLSGNIVTVKASGIANDGNSSIPIINNSILWAGDYGQFYFWNGSSAIITDSVVEGGCPVGASCTNIINANPQLGLLADNGGHTKTMALGSGSSAIDAGGVNSVCVATDQRGLRRPQGAACDNGAYEDAHGSVLHAMPNGSTTGECDSWENACELSYVLAIAFSGHEIWAAAGTYKPIAGSDRTATFQLAAGVFVYGGFAGTETSRDQRNPTINLTILSGDIDNNDSQTPVITDLTSVTGNTTNSHHVVTGADGATLDGFIITAGYAYGSTSDGGGMYISSGNQTLENVTFSGNSASDRGGGIYCSSANLALMNVNFTGNLAHGYGGGVALVSTAGDSPSLTNVTFTGNSAGYYGGGLYNIYSSPILTNVTFNNNSALSNGGGGISNFYSNPTLKNVTFNGNWTNFLGGGMYNTSGSPTLTNTTFRGNSAGYYGGGLYNEGNSSLTNITFSGNSANVKGGGMYSSSGTPIINNTIFWDNTAFDGSQIRSYSDTPILSDSVVEGGCPAGSTCTNIITIHPHLGTLGNYGGFTQTIPLQEGSSAIDSGNDATCDTTDQRGISRPQGIHCDVGAFEVEAYTLNITSVNGTVAKNPNQATYHEGDVVQLTATPDTGWSFANWTGDLTSSVNPDSVTIHGNTLVTANYTLDNRTPTDVSISNNSVSENQAAGTTVGTFSSTDPDAGDTFTYSLVSGTGSADNASFTISGDLLKTAYPFNFMSKNSYSIRVRTTDQGGLNFEKVFTINVTDLPAIFADVPDTYWSNSYIERLYNAGITGGCSVIPLNYCPTNQVTRAQMAIFLLRGIHGSTYTPPAATGTMFGDVTAGTFGAAWIEQLATEGITSGCGGGNFCPSSPVTRASMAIFLVRAKHGAAFIPPTATGIFSDVPIGSFGANYIEQLVADSITSGCGAGVYCPNTTVKRDSMAVFLVRTFNLP